MFESGYTLVAQHSEKTTFLTPIYLTLIRTSPHCGSVHLTFLQRPWRCAGLLWNAILASLLFHLKTGLSYAIPGVYAFSAA